MGSGLPGWVTIVLTGSGAITRHQPFRRLTVTITAPTTGTTVGMAFFQDRCATDHHPATTNNLNGGSGQSITGASIFQTRRQTGGALRRTPIEIARAVSITGNATLKLDCTGPACANRRQRRTADDGRIAMPVHRTSSTALRALWIAAARRQSEFP